MSAQRNAYRLRDPGEARRDERTTIPSPNRRPSGTRRRATPRRLDPLEEALIARPLWDSRAHDPGVHEILYRFSVGDLAGALAAATVLLGGQSVPALATSVHVLDELDLDLEAAAILAAVDGTTVLSAVLAQCGLEPHHALRTLCELLERRLLVLRKPARP